MVNQTLEMLDEDGNVIKTGYCWSVTESGDLNVYSNKQQEIWYVHGKNTARIRVKKESAK